MDLRLSLLTLLSRARSRLMVSFELYPQDIKHIDSAVHHMKSDLPKALYYHTLQIAQHGQ